MKKGNFWVGAIIAILVIIVFASILLSGLKKGAAVTKKMGDLYSTANVPDIMGVEDNVVCAPWISEEDKTRFTRVVKSYKTVNDAYGLISIWYEPEEGYQWNDPGSAPHLFDKDEYKLFYSSGKNDILITLVQSGKNRVACQGLVPDEELCVVAGEDGSYVYPKSAELCLDKLYQLEKSTSRTRADYASAQEFCSKMLYSRPAKYALLEEDKLTMYFEDSQQEEEYDYKHLSTRLPADRIPGVHSTSQMVWMPAVFLFQEKYKGNVRKCLLPVKSGGTDENGIQESTLQKMFMDVYGVDIFIESCELARCNDFISGLVEDCTDNVCGLNCFPGYSEGGGYESCEDCNSIGDCSGYTSEEQCERDPCAFSEDCLVTITRDGEFGECGTCAAITDCGSYVSMDDCRLDICELGCYVQEFYAPELDNPGVCMPCPECGGLSEDKCEEMSMCGCTAEYEDDNYMSCKER